MSDKKEEMFDLLSRAFSDDPPDIVHDLLSKDLKRSGFITLGSLADWLSELLADGEHEKLRFLFGPNAEEEARDLILQIKKVLPN